MTQDEFFAAVDTDLTPEVLAALDLLHTAGFAVVAWTPTELRGERMTVTLTVFFNTDLSTLTEMHASVEDAADMVLHISNVMGAEIFPADVSTFGHQGHLYRDHPDRAVVATYDIEEN